VTVLRINSAVGKPLLVLVSGRPGSGKSTLARKLSEESVLWLPHVAVDSFRTGMSETIGSWGKVTGAEVYAVFYRTVEALLRDGVSLIVEASFQPRFDEARLRPLLEISRAVNVHCIADAELARERFLVREPSRRRRSGPEMAGVVGQIDRREFEWSWFESMEIGVPRLEVDTSAGYRPGLAEIVAFCEPLR
jgi:predicted kinase